MSNTHVGAPEVDEGVNERRAGGHIHHPDVHQQLYAALVLNEVLPDELVVDVVGLQGKTLACQLCKSFRMLYTKEQRGKTTDAFDSLGREDTCGVLEARVVRLGAVSACRAS